MKKLSFKTASIVTVCLMGVSAIASAFVPNAKEEDEQAPDAVRGITINSTAGGPQPLSRTAIQGNGNASYTVTVGKPGGLSATSVNNAATDTHAVGNYTGYDTTHDDWGTGLI